MSYGSLQKYLTTPLTTTSANTITTTSTGTSIGYPTNYTIHLSPDTYATTTFEFDLNKDFYNFMTVKGKESSNQIVNIVEYVPQKVYKIVFADHTEVKTIKDNFDNFSVEYMLCLALAKKLYSKDYTFDGVLRKAWNIQDEKKYDKIIKRGIKLFNKLQKEKKKKEEYDEIKKRQYKKLIEKKKRAKEKKRQEQVNIIADAIRLSKEEA